MIEAHRQQDVIDIGEDTNIEQKLDVFIYLFFIGFCVVIKMSYTNPTHEYHPFSQIQQEITWLIENQYSFFALVSILVKHRGA